MAKELMEIGGFITSGAEIVNHDASLSGNGTVDSPLGVVPGYNETVLWSGVYSGNVSNNNYITLTEAPSAFEFVKVINGGGYKSCYEFDGTSDTWSFMQTFANTANQTTVYCERLGVDHANKKVTCLAANYFTVTQNKTIGAWESRAMNVGEIQLTKVIGINRKAQ